MKTASLLVAALALAASAGCSSKPAAEGETPGDLYGAGVRGEPRSYHVVYSAQRGKVGYAKVFDVAEGGGPVFQWKYVYDLDWKELGYIDQLGTAYQYKPYTPFERDYQPGTIRVVRLPSDSTERNAMRMLGMDPALDDVTFPEATAADLASAPTVQAK